jgi:hypothetical protein
MNDCVTKIYVEVVGRKKNWFAKVKRATGPFAVLKGELGPGFIPCVSLVTPAVVSIPAVNFVTPSGTLTKFILYFRLLEDFTNARTTRKESNREESQA